MRVVFFGTPDFAVPTLDAVVAAGHEVLLVVAQPDRPAGRGHHLRAPPTVVRARQLGLEVAQPRALREGPFPDRLVGLDADVGLVVAYGRILPLRLLEAPRHGCVNLHASLLPRWRGAAPIQAAIAAGDPLTGVCTQRMEEGLDTGPILLSAETPIGPRETAGELHDRLARLGAEVVVATLDRLPRSEAVPQDPDAATYAPKLDKDFGRVDLAGSAVAIDRRVRAATPWPGGWLPLPDGPLKLLDVQPTSGLGVPGTILSTHPLVVACGTGALALHEVQAPGRRPVAGEAYANGLRLVVGDVLGRPR